MTDEIAVECSRVADRWRCTVRAGTDAGATVHDVAVSAETLQRLRPGSDDPTEVVRDSFAFLLAREPRKAILRSFELPLIARYFPEWEAEVRRSG
ncbi:MAG TPA: hypothetical protein VHK63_07720 [Candidatus Limnocylindria bacterium]|nr:hypothetical protein [Candidatus Limnocylindria bacterium]